MFPLLLIVVGIAVLVFGRRPSVLGAAAGALLGMGLLHLFPAERDGWLEFLIPLGLAVLGFIGAAFAKGFIEIILMVIGALAGAAIALGLLDLFTLDFGVLDWLLVLVGGVIGLVMVRRYREWTMIVLAGLIGGLLITRGLSIWLPSVQDALRAVLVVVLAGGGIGYQGRAYMKEGAAAKR